jgi:hypothetical protein
MEEGGGVVKVVKVVMVVMVVMKVMLVMGGNPLCIASFMVCSGGDRWMRGWKIGSDYHLQRNLLRLWTTLVGVVAVITLLSHCCFTVVTLLLHC